jgi:hypothetical protein
MRRNTNPNAPYIPAPFSTEELRKVIGTMMLAAAAVAAVERRRLLLLPAPYVCSSAACTKLLTRRRTRARRAQGLMARILVFIFAPMDWKQKQDRSDRKEISEMVGGLYI